MPKVIEENKSITKEVTSQFIRLLVAEQTNMEDLQEVYQSSKLSSYTALKRLTSICLMKGEYEDYLHLKRYWKHYARKYQIEKEAGEAWTRL